MDPAAHDDPPTPVAPPPSEPINVVRVDGKDLPVADLAAVQRLIVEGRLTRDAMLSNHGMRWTRAGDREDLAIFFAAADAIAFHERNLRTEVRPVEDEIVVDMEEADDRTPGVPVAIGPGLDPLGRQDLDTMIVDFGMGRDDTVEQTVRSGSVDETPIPEVPAGFARVEPDPTERLRPAPVRLPDGPPAGSPVSGIPVPAAISTVTPADAPKGSAAFGGGGPRVPATLVPAPNPSLSQSFFMDPTPVVSSPKPPPDRDVFDEPSGVTDRPRSSWLPMMAGGAVLLAILLVGAVVVFRPPAEPAKEPVAVAEPTPAPEPSPPPAPAPEATPAPEDPPAQPEATPAPEPTPAPPPEATPAPVPPAPASTVQTPKPPREPKPPAQTEPRASGSPKSLIASGWKAVEAEDFTKAHGLFDRALSSAPSATAYYGRAYANEKLGDTVSAAEDYCNALTTGSVDVGTSREIEAGLRRIGRSCP